jgi:hypothetical protein
MPEQPVAMTPGQPQTETPEVTQPLVMALGLQGRQAMEIDGGLEDGN